MLLALCSMAKGATDGWLITPEEAQMQIRDGSYADPVSAIEGYGPAIVVKRPKMLQQLSSPIDILVSFEPGMNGYPKRSVLKSPKPIPNRFGEVR